MNDREFAVILEGIRSDFKVFNEGLTQLRDDTNKQFKEVRAEFKEVRTEIKEIRQDIGKLNEKIDTVHVQLMDFSDDVKQILNNHEARLVKLEK